jgi:hypothetical protein
LRASATVYHVLNSSGYRKSVAGQGRQQDPIPGTGAQNRPLTKPSLPNLAESKKGAGHAPLRGESDVEFAIATIVDQYVGVGPIQVYMDGRAV